MVGNKNPARVWVRHTFLDVLVLVEGLQSVALGETSEGVDEVGAEVGVDVLRGELGRARSIDRPVGVVADDLSLGISCANKSVLLIDPFLVPTARDSGAPRGETASRRN